MGKGGDTLLGVMLLVFVLGAIILVAYYDPFGVKTAATSVIQQQVTNFQTGDKIAFNLPPLQPVLPSNQTGSNVVQKSQSATTPVSTPSIPASANVSIPVSSQNTSISGKSFTGSLSLSGGANPNSIGIQNVRIGSIAVISGQISIIDPITKQKVNPPYQYQLSITCHFRDDCNNNSNLSVPPQYTDTLGGFEYHWTTNTDRDKPGEYIATIDTLSQTPDPQGKPYALESQYHFFLVS